MRSEWSIPAKKGKSNVFGLSKHSWQALALGTLYFKGYMPVIIKNRKEREVRKQKVKAEKKKAKLAA